MTAGLYVWREGIGGGVLLLPPHKTLLNPRGSAEGRWEVTLQSSGLFNWQPATPTLSLFSQYLPGCWGITRVHCQCINASSSFLPSSSALVSAHWKSITPHFRAWVYTWLLSRITEDYAKLVVRGDGGVKKYLLCLQAIVSCSGSENIALRQQQRQLRCRVACTAQNISPKGR